MRGSDSCSASLENFMKGHSSQSVRIGQHVARLNEGVE
jgi:hypothetical protein